MSTTRSTGTRHETWKVTHRRNDIHTKPRGWTARRNVSNCDSIDYCWRMLITTIYIIAGSQLEYGTKSRWNDCFDEKCQSILRNKDTARTVMLQPISRQNVKSYRGGKSKLVHSELKRTFGSRLNANNLNNIVNP